MARALTSQEKTYLRADGQICLLYLSVLVPSVVFRARVNGTPSSLDKLVEVDYDGGDGNYGDTIAGMTVYFGTSQDAFDIGLARLRAAPSADSGTLKIGETSELDIEDNQYITVVDEFALWPKHLRIDSGGTIYMDYDVTYSDQHENPDPAVIMGPPGIVYLEGGSETVSFDATLTWAPGASVSSYSWSATRCATQAAAGTWDDSTSGTPTLTLTSADGDVIRINCTVTMDNGASYTGRRYVFIYNLRGDSPSEPTTEFTLLSCAGSWDTGGWSFQVDLNDSALLSEVRDRTLVILHAIDYYGGTKTSIGPLDSNRRADVIAVGWVTDRSIVYDPRAPSVTFEVQGPQYWLGQMSGFPSGLEDYDGTPTTWLEMEDLTVDKGIWHFLHWRSTASSVLDVFRTEDTREIAAFDAPPGSLWQQLTQVCESTILARPCCDRYGRLFVEVDTNLVPTGDRGSFPVVMDVTTQDWRDELIIARNVVPPVGLLDASGVAYAAGTGSALFSLSPGHVPKHYGGLQRLERLALSDQSQANTLAGLILGKHNNEWPNTVIQFGANFRAADIVPHQYLTMSIAASETERGFTWSTKKLIPRRVAFTHKPATGVLLTDIEVEGYTTDELAVDGDPPPDPPDPCDSDYPPDLTEPEPDPFPEGPIKASIMWDKTHVGYTSDLLEHHIHSTCTTGTTGTTLTDSETDFEDAGVEVGDYVDNMLAGASYDRTTVAAVAPGGDEHTLTLTADIGLSPDDEYHVCGTSWTDKTGSLSGNIIDIQYVRTGTDTVAAWCMTADAIYYASNAFSLSWSEKLTIETAQGWGDDWVDAEFRGMCIWDSEPDGLTISFYMPEGKTSGYGIAYTDDSGTSWNHPQVFPTSGGDGSEAVHKFYCNAPYNSCVAGRDGVLFLLRGGSTTLPAYAGTWVWRHAWPPTGAEFTKGTNRVSTYQHYAISAGIHRPYLGGALYVTISDCVDTAPEKSSDDGDTWAGMTIPTGYSDLTSNNPVVGYYGSADDVLMMFIKDADSHRCLLRSDDGGSTWTEIGDADDEFNNPPVGYNGFSIARPMHPWPNDEDVILWVRLCNDGGVATDALIRYTDDEGENWFNKTGDWMTGVGGWDGGIDNDTATCGCLPLPRVGTNA